MMAREIHTERLLTHIEATPIASQRSLARELGIALGLTNLLLRRLVRKGMVKIVEATPNRLMYCITPEGIAEKARLSRTYLENSIQFYREARERIRERFDVLSTGWVSQDDTTTVSEKRVVFYGTGEVAEIGYVCLQDTDLTLVGVVGEGRSTAFFGLPVNSLHSLTGTHLDGRPFERLVVMAFHDVDTILDRLRDRGVSTASAFLL